MRKLVIFGVGLLALCAMASPAAAATFECNDVVTGGTFDNVRVPRDGSCTLVDSTVAGDVKVKRNGYFQATNTAIGGRVSADDALTLFLDTDSTVGRTVRSDDTAQVFIFNATVGRGIEIDDTLQVVQICGTTVTKGDVEVRDSGVDILVGDPLAEGCSGNTLADGDLELKRNTAEVEFVVRGNTVTAGDLEVIRNRGPVEKFVQDNTGGDELECHGNEELFTASGNTGWKDIEGQCRNVLTCDAVATGVSVDDVIVPVDGSCTLVDSTVSGNVFVSRGAFFQATNTDIGGKVRAQDALTLFIDTDSTVGRSVKARGTAQVFVFNATVRGDVDVEDTTEVAQICGANVGDDVEVERSGIDILVGDPLAEGCAGNTVGGDLEVEHNVAQSELVVRGNTVGGDLEVEHNSGPVEKFVQDNTGGDELECHGNEEPFTASGNMGFARVEGQCIEAAPLTEPGV
jgi:hypothetical protein